MNTNSENPKVGKAFQELVCKSLEKYFNTDFNLEVPIPIGIPAKDHHFDCVSDTGKIVVECKCYTWTESGNIPSAKIRGLNEAVFYMNFLPEDKIKILCIATALHSHKSESLAEYYHRINGHLLGNVKLFEIDKSGNITIIRN